MGRRFTFADVLKQAPEIKAVELLVFHSMRETTFTPKEHDKQYAKRPYSGKNFICGKGTFYCPYDYASAAPVSPHYAICDLWYKFRKLSSTYIEINDCMFCINSKGVTAIDGTFTKLLPDKPKPKAMKSPK